MGSGNSVFFNKIGDGPPCCNALLMAETVGASFGPAWGWVGTSVYVILYYEQSIHGVRCSFRCQITSPDSELGVYSCPVSKVTNDTLCIWADRHT